MRPDPYRLLRWLPRRVRDRVRDRTSFHRRPAAILMYHRVAELPTDPQRLAVTPSRFAAHLEVVRQLAKPVPLGAFQNPDRLPNGGPPQVAITFDDGYADNLAHAHPLLHRYETPATVFVATDYAGSDREFWWDDLERLILLPPQLPPALRLVIRRQALSWHFPSGSGPDAAWSVLSEAPHSPRQQAYLQLARLLGRLPPDLREDVLTHLAAWSGQRREGRATHRPMTADELRALRSGGLVELGAHTARHPMLSRLRSAQQSEEIQASRQWLERTCGAPISRFAYPIGTRDAYTPATVRQVRRAGFACACTTACRPVSALDNAFELPRCVVRDWPAEEFLTRLRLWLHG